MNQDFLSPINGRVAENITFQSDNCFGKTVRIYTDQSGFPELDGVALAILGVKEGRNSIDNEGCGENLSAIREKLYGLFPGNWSTQIADIGNIEPGNAVEDTYFARERSPLCLLRNTSVCPLRVMSRFGLKTCQTQNTWKVCLFLRCQWKWMYAAEDASVTDRTRLWQ